MRPSVLVTALPLVLLTCVASEGQEPETPRSSGLPISQLTNEHPVMKAALQEGEEDLPAWREASSWSEICEHDDLTGQVGSCHLRSPIYSEATSSAPGFYTALLLVYCDGTVQVVTDRGQINSKGIPVSGEAMRPTRVILKGQVQKAADSVRHTLFVSDSADWAGTTLAFEARHSDNETAVWRLPFGELERQIVEGFLKGAMCPRAEPPAVVAASPIVVPPERISGGTPPLPKEARRVGVRGWLDLRLTISETGDVVDVAVTREAYVGRGYGKERRGHAERRRSAEEQTTAMAVATVREWKYRPATADGQPIRIHSDVRVTYGF